MPVFQLFPITQLNSGTVTMQVISNRLITTKTLCTRDRACTGSTLIDSLGKLSMFRKYVEYIDPDQSRDCHPAEFVSWSADKGFATMTW